MRKALTILIVIWLAPLAWGELNYHAKTETLLTSSDGVVGHRLDHRTDGEPVMLPASLTNSITLAYSFGQRDNAGTNYYDVSVSTNDGTQTTTANIPAWTSASGGYATFDNLNDFVTFGSWTASAATFVAVVRLDIGATEHGIVGWGNANNNTYFRLSYGASWVQVGRRTAAGNYYVRRSAGPPPANVLQCMVGTIAPPPTKRNKYYLNGTEVALATVLDAGTTAASLTDTFVIGGRQGTAYFFNGDMYEFWVLDKECTSNEVTNIVYPILQKRYPTLP